MTLDIAINMLKVEYEKALKQERIHNPLAYALYQVWRKADTCTHKINTRGDDKRA